MIMLHSALGRRITIIIIIIIKKDSEFGSFVVGSFWAALGTRGTKHFELKRDFSLPLEFNFNSSYVY